MHLAIVGKPDQQRGMTMVEIVVVLVLAGILAAFVVPRFMNTGSYAERAAQDRLVAAARYAQQVAMNKGPGSTVRLVISGGTYRIDVNGTPITLPTGGTSQALPWVTTTAITLSYSPLGNTTPATITITGSEGTGHVCIESTGYAHGC